MTSLRSAPNYFLRLVFILSVFLFSLLQPAYISAQEKPSAAHKLEPVTLGLSAKHVLNLPIYLAQRYGIFASEGFDLKPITTKTSTAIAALVLIRKDWNLDRATSQLAYDAAIATYNFKGEGSDEIINAAIKRAQQDAKIIQSTFAPRDFVDWNPIRAVQQDLKR